ncbi:MAG: hypothetical protein AAFQ32_12700 [Pseudomonadota bacterium]
MDPSGYQALKLWLQGYIPLDRDAFHVVIGAAILLATLLRKRPLSLALAGALLAGITMEALDARDDLRSFGFWRWRECMADILLTIAAPLLVFAFTAAKAAWQAFRTPP